MKKNYRLGKAGSAPEEIPAMKEAGFDFAESSVDELLFPEMGQEEWAVQKAKIMEAQKYLPYVSCNGFLPGKFRLTGPETTWPAALDYAETACRRADEVGIPYIVFGSSGARNIPEGYDHEAGMAQFVEFCKQLCNRIADCKVTVLLENLQQKESNVLNHLSDSIAVVDAVNSPRLQMMVDTYHVCQGGDTADDIRKAGKRIFHVHIACPATRRYPGYSEADLHRYVQALNDIDYQGGLSMECGWSPKPEQWPTLWRKAIAVTREWIEETH